MSVLRRLVWGLSLGASSLQLSVLAVALLVGGCASRQGEQQAYSAHMRGPDAQVADARDAGGPAQKEDVEGDGMPAQLPPPRRERPMPDDPREPWSPNYGSAKPVRSANAAD